MAVVMRSNTLADNRALLQVLTHSENTGQLPEDIVKTAVAGGVVSFFVDEEKRYTDAVVLPSSRDLSTLAILIAEGFFAPFLCRTVGDPFSHYTVIAESGCFEPLSLPVLLFPDCFFEPSTTHLTLHTASSLSRSPVKGHGNDPTPESFLTLSVSTPVTEVVDILELHRLRTYVGLLLFKSVNEVLYDAEISKLQTSKQKTTVAACEAAATSAVMALFYELKILLLCCVMSTNKAYALKGCRSPGFQKSAHNYFEELLPSEVVNNIFDHGSRRCAGDVALWYDDMLRNLKGNMSLDDGDLPGMFLELHSKVAEEGQKVSRMPVQLLHRPHDAASATTLQLTFSHIELPHLATQPGELTLLLLNPLGHSLIFDSESSKLCFLLRRCATVKLTGTQLRTAELFLAKLPWCNLRGAVVESVQFHLSSDEFLASMVEKNSSFVARLIQWLREIPTTQEDAASVRDEETDRLGAIGTSMANYIVEHAIQTSPFGTAIAQFIREVVNCGALNEAQLHKWVERSLPELENKASATIELFALVVAFSLAHRGWDLPEPISEPVINLCTQNKQQPNCLTLLNFLRRHSQ